MIARAPSTNYFLTEKIWFGNTTLFLKEMMMMVCVWSLLISHTNVEAANFCVSVDSIDVICSDYSDNIIDVSLSESTTDSGNINDCPAVKRWKSTVLAAGFRASVDSIDVGCSDNIISENYFFKTLPEINFGGYKSQNHYFYV
jgi:hypothetical protein